jgi:demethylmenaquinone methyltransferase/2-methoxy-6-polyprenyl-1,4-benzoquinol methylase
MTFGGDQRWRRSLVERLGVSPDDRVLDLACGTGDFAALCKERGASVVGADFSRGMLLAARARDSALPSVQADALRLPFAEASFTVVVSGFALRNFTNLPAVFAEAARVLRPGGRLGLLEVDRPRNRIVRAGHAAYFERVVPRLGGLIGRDAAYRYLPQSAAYLPLERDLVGMLAEAGFNRVQKHRPMLGAIQAVKAVRRWP